MFGFWTNMEREDKYKVGLLVLVMAATGFMFYRNWGEITGNTPDTTVTSWVEEKTYAMDTSKPLGADNVDPRSTRDTIFANAKGQVHLLEFPYDSTRPNAIFVFSKPDRRHTMVAQFDPYDQAVQTTSDADKRLMTFALMNEQAPHRRPMGFWDLNLSDDQTKTERDARDSLNNEIEMISTAENTGTFETKLFQEIKTTLDTFRANGDDIKTSKSKQAQADKIIALSQQYIQKIKDAQDKVIAVYVNKMHDTLTSEQRTRLSERFDALAVRLGRKPAAG